jgi:Ca2+-transporting ATPase
MAVGTLGVIVYASNNYGDAVAHTMGLATFSVFNLLFSLETADENRTLFSSELLENPMLLKTTALSIVTIVLATELGILQRILGTVGLSIEQWGICVLVGASIVVVAEIKKLLRIQTDETAIAAPASAAA